MADTCSRAQDVDGLTPLAFAAHRGHGDVVVALLRGNAALVSSVDGAVFGTFARLQLFC